MTEKIFIISCIVYAIHYSMLEDEIFSFVRKRWDKVENELWGNECVLPLTKHPNILKFMLNARNPVFDCPVCMCPWWGTILYWLLFHNTVVEWIICIFAAMGLNYIIAKLSPEK